MANKRKTGKKRTASGRLSRAKDNLDAPKFDHGTERAAAKFLRFGTDGADAIGRAYVSGLLGKGQDAKTLLDTARAIFRAYWAWYEIGPIRCTLADRNSGAGVDNDSDREAKQEAWLNDMLSKAGKQGFNKRTWFDELVIDQNPDCGPIWLDAILERRSTAMDELKLQTVLGILNDCANIVENRKAA